MTDIDLETKLTETVSSLPSPLVRDIKQWMFEGAMLLEELERKHPEATNDLCGADILNQIDVYELVYAPKEDEVFPDEGMVAKGVNKLVDLVPHWLSPLYFRWAAEYARTLAEEAGIDQKHKRFLHRSVDPLSPEDDQGGPATPEGKRAPRKKSELTIAGIMKRRLAVSQENEVSSLYTDENTPAGEIEGSIEGVEPIAKTKLDQEQSVQPKFADVSSPKALGEFLVSKRKQKGIPQKTVAEIMQTDASNVAKLENGQGNPTLSTLTKYGEAIGVTFGLKELDD